MIEPFKKICAFRKEHPGIRGSGLPVNSPKLVSVKKDLDSLKEELKRLFENHRGFNFTFEVSKGQTYFPSILHISILPPNQLVSNGIYVVICFDILGRGALIGCAESVTNPKGLTTLPRKQKNAKLNIDVDGLRETTRYNNAFENPKEFTSNLEDEKEMLKHISVSLDLALYHLGLSKDLNLRIKERVVANVDTLEFSPIDIVDGKEKIARFITNRRGQKKFRMLILNAYQNRCAVTGSEVECILEAAHIFPYKGDKTNHVQNGILLRSDIHLLFDLGKLTIDAKSKRVKIHDSIKKTNYGKYHDVPIKLPTITANHPNEEALTYHNENEFER